MDRYEKRPAIYTAFSKHYFYTKMLISAYVLDQDLIPLNPFNNWEYFMDDMIDRELVVRANNNLILLADEVWTFGPIADGVYAEIQLANSLGKPVRYFSLGNTRQSIQPITEDQLIFEDELLQKVDIHTIMDDIRRSTAVSSL